jgi:hypothetical protein
VLDEIIVHGEGVERVPLGLKTGALAATFSGGADTEVGLGFGICGLLKLAGLPASVSLPTNF